MSCIVRFCSCLSSSPLTFSSVASISGSDDIVVNFCGALAMHRLGAGAPQKETSGVCRQRRSAEEGGDMRFEVGQRRAGEKAYSGGGVSGKQGYGAQADEGGLREAEQAKFARA